MAYTHTLPFTFSVKMDSKSQNMLLWILKQKINSVALDHMLSHYLNPGSEYNGDALPKSFKGLSSIPKPATGSTKNKTA